MKENFARVSSLRWRQRGRIIEVERRRVKNVSSRRKGEQKMKVPEQSIVIPERSAMAMFMF